MQRLFQQLVPFIMIGIAIVAFVFGIVLLAYLFLFGAVVGLVLFVISWVRDKFFPPKTITKAKKPRAGRIIDSDDFTSSH